MDALLGFFFCALAFVWTIKALVLAGSALVELVNSFDWSIPRSSAKRPVSSPAIAKRPASPAGVTPKQAVSSAKSPLVRGSYRASIIMNLD